MKHSCAQFIWQRDDAFICIRCCSVQQQTCCSICRRAMFSDCNLWHSSIAWWYNRAACFSRPASDCCAPSWPAPCIYLSTSSAYYCCLRYGIHLLHGGTSRLHASAFLSLTVLHPTGLYCIHTSTVTSMEKRNKQVLA